MTETDLLFWAFTPAVILRRKPKNLLSKVLLTRFFTAFRMTERGQFRMTEKGQFRMTERGQFRMTAEGGLKVTMDYK